MKKFSKVMMCLLILCSAALAQSRVSMNLTTVAVDSTLSPTDVAGLRTLATANWNNVVWVTGSGSPVTAPALIDNTGAASAITLTYLINNQWGDGTAVGPGVDNKLARRYFDDGPVSGATPYLTVSNIPYQSYAVVLYLSTDGIKDHYSPFTVNGITKIAAPALRFNSSYSWIENQNVLVFDNLAGASVTVPMVRNTTGNWDRASIAGVQIVNTSNMATQPQPANSAKEILVNSDLSWTAPAAYTTVQYTVYADPNIIKVEERDPGCEYVETQTDTTLITNGLSFSEEYFWVVDSKNTVTNQTNEGYLWSFTTRSSFPELTAQLVGATVPAGEDVVLSVSGYNLASCQWYKDGVLVATQTPENDPKLENTFTLTIPAVTQANGEGLYHAVVENGNQDDDPLESAKVMVMERRQLAQWSFEENMLDNIGGWNGSMYVDVNDPNYVPASPVYVDGFVGKAFDFDGTAASSVVIDGSDPVLGLAYGVTAAAWVKTDGQTNSWAIIIAKGFPGWRLGANAAGDRPIFHVNTNNGGASATASTDINDGQWHLLVGTFDGTTSRIYINGELDGSGSVPAGSIGTAISQNSSNVWIGGRQDNPTGRNWTGQVDEARIYNYALTNEDVAQLYFDYTSNRTCLYPPELDYTGPDGVKDCIVNLYDFALLANTWLESGLRPE